MRRWASYRCFSPWFLTVWWHCLWLKLFPKGPESFLQLPPWPFSDCPFPSDWLYGVANRCSKISLHCWIIQLSKILPYFKPKEKFHQNKKIQSKYPGRFTCKNNHNRIKFSNSLSLHDLIYLGLYINDHSVQGHDNSQCFINYFSSVCCVQIRTVYGSDLPPQGGHNPKEKPHMHISLQHNSGMLTYEQCYERKIRKWYILHGAVVIRKRMRKRSEKVPPWT